MEPLDTAPAAEDGFLSPGAPIEVEDGSGLLVSLGSVPVTESTHSTEETGAPDVAESPEADISEPESLEILDEHEEPSSVDDAGDGTGIVAPWDSLLFNPPFPTSFLPRPFDSTPFLASFPSWEGSPKMLFVGVEVVVGSSTVGFATRTKSLVGVAVVEGSVHVGPPMVLAEGETIVPLSSLQSSKKNDEDEDEKLLTPLPKRQEVGIVFPLSLRSVVALIPPSETLGIKAGVSLAVATPVLAAIPRDLPPNVLLCDATDPSFLLLMWLLIGWDDENGIRPMRMKVENILTMFQGRKRRK